MSRLKNLFNDKQAYTLELNNYYKPEIMILDGAFRSGKSVINNVLFTQHILQFKGRHVDFIMTGHSIGSLERNVLKPMRDDFGVNTHLDEYSRFELFGNKINCFGTEKSNADENIQGMTAYGWLANELTLTHINAYKMAMSRCSGIGARKFFDMNPAAPQHHLYQNYVEPWQKIGNNQKVCRVNWKMRDNDKVHNGFLTEIYIQGMEKDYTGIWYKKYIEGQWVALEGQIYFLENLQYYDDSVLENRQWWIGVVCNGYMDPATGSTKKTGCFTSAIAGALKNGNIYITDAVVKKIMPNEIHSAVGDLIRKRNYAVFAVEDNFSQDGYVVKPLKQAFPFVNIIGQSSREDKLSRLIGMHPVVMSKVFFPQRWLQERNSDGWLLLQQLCNITKDRKADVAGDDYMLDAPDALEGLLRTFRAYSGNGSVAVGGGDVEAVRQKQIW